ncbi:MAG: zinc ribbon domain-containing protein [Clostridiales bacterium]|nr:zinc ribbon domain-containing protein [Clostridiales bacterium]
MICSHCHKEILDGAVFCTECGYLIRSGEATDILTPELTKTEVSPSDMPETPANPETSSAPVLTPFMAPAAPETTAPAAPLPQVQYDTRMLGQPGFVPQASAFPYAYEEGPYYHINAREEYDFEAMRGISIVLIIVSALTLVGILMPLPLSIASLVKACSGMGERNPYEKTKKFNSSRTLIITSICILLFYAVLFAVIFLFASAWGFSMLPAQK